MQLGASLSPPQRAQMLATSSSMQLFSHSSAFGPLSELSSRRTFAYLIATLNASHPHYDFSNVLRPNDFKRERNLRKAMGTLDSILQNVRPSNLESKSFNSSENEPTATWGPQCWSLIDKEMRLNECTVFTYHPEVDPFEEDESAIWSAHHFFFHRALKRVAYLYIRVVPVTSSTSLSRHLAWRHADLGEDLSHSSADASDFNQWDLGSDGSLKRANYWLGDRSVQLEPYEPGDDDKGTDDGLWWNRREDGDLVGVSDDDFWRFDEDDNDEEDETNMHYYGDGGDRPRFMSEDIAGRMEL